MFIVVVVFVTHFLYFLLLNFILSEDRDMES